MVKMRVPLDARNPSTLGKTANKFLCTTIIEPKYYSTKYNYQTIYNI